MDVWLSQLAESPSAGGSPRHIAFLHWWPSFPVLLYPGRDRKVQTFHQGFFTFPEICQSASLKHYPLFGGGIMQSSRLSSHLLGCIFVKEPLRNNSGNRNAPAALYTNKIFPVKKVSASPPLDQKSCQRRYQSMKICLHKKAKSLKPSQPPSNELGVCTQSCYAVVMDQEGTQFLAKLLQLLPSSPRVVLELVKV